MQNGERLFDWKSRIGDIEAGRQNLGGSMPVAVYRLMQYTIRDELVARYGPKAADEVIRSAGFLAGISFAQNILERKDDFFEFVAELQQKLKDYAIGILRIERANLEDMSFTLTISEDLDCSGLPVTGEVVCSYDEGFIAGLLQDYTGQPFDVKEIDCWATGVHTCRFRAKGIA